MAFAEAAEHTPDLDLAFEADDTLAAELLSAAGDLADPMAGAELWHGRISDFDNRGGRGQCIGRCSL